MLKAKPLTQAWRGPLPFELPPLVRRTSSAVTRGATLANQVAVVTGSTKGIGFAIARRLAQDGAHVVVSSRKQQNVDQAVVELQGEGLSVSGTVCHVGKAEDREPGGHDAECHCEGPSPAADSAAAPHGEEKKLRAYNVSKTALLGLTKALAVELAPKNIRVNCLVPGVIDTAFSQVVFEDPSLWTYMKALCGTQRVGQPEDCAGIVSFLCSSDASYITAESIMVAGCSFHL
nr:dehydrogenase/reductase SDR family member 2, mitochondrial-like isoform X1 [Loxodonta africana]